MPSPDQSTYSTLTLYDKGPFELIQTAVREAQLKSGWVPRVGTIDMAIMQSLCMIVSEAIFAINRLPDGIMEILLKQFGIVRELGTPPSTTITITSVDTVGYSIPVGSEFRLDNGVDFIVFSTSEAAVISPGATQTTVSAVGKTNTSIWNGVLPCETLSLLSSLAFVQVARTETAVSGGEDPEDAQAWRDRGVQVFRSLNSSLVLPDQFTTKALTFPGVFRAYTKNNWDGVADAPASGHVTVSVADSTGTALSDESMLTIQQDLDAQSQAGLIVTVVPPTYNQITVSASAVAKPNFVASLVQGAVEQAIIDYLSPASWPWKEKVYHNELISLIDRVEGVERVVSVQAGFEGDTPDIVDLSLIGTFPLTTAGTIVGNVTVSAS